MSELFDVVAEVEMSYKVKRPKPYSRYVIHNSRDCFESIEAYYNQNNLQHHYREFFGCMLLNRRNGVLGFLLISSGTTTGCLIDPKSIIVAISKANASSVILFHNHPSGNLRPSEADIRLTKGAKQLLEVMNVSLLDHVIMAPDFSDHSYGDIGNRFYSMADNADF